MIRSDRSNARSWCGTPWSSRPPFGGSYQRGLRARVRRGAPEKELDVVQELRQGLAPMIAGDIGVEFSPQPLDPVVLRRVGRQKMQHDPTAELLGQRALHQRAGVDAVVVENHM